MNVSKAIKVVRLTDKGLVRDQNEDAVASDLNTGLLVLADGMGGYRAGEIASEIAVLTLTAEISAMADIPSKSDQHFGHTMPESQALINAVKIANAAIFKVSKQEQSCAGMGTTLVAAIFANNKLSVGHIGDSRMYRLRAGRLKLLTQDHSILQEQLSTGLITPQQAKLATNKNLVTRALGVDEQVELELNEFNVKVHDLYLLCSDGLSDFVDDDEILKILIDTDGNMNLAAFLLIKAANEQGGLDNSSVVIAVVNKKFALKKSWIKKFF